MANTNLDKFMQIERMMNEADSLMNVYLAVLQERHEYMSEYRVEYKKLRRRTYDVINSLQKESEDNEEKETLIKSARNKVSDILEGVKEAQDTDMTEDYTKAIKSLADALESLETPNKEAIEHVQTVISKTPYKVPEIDLLAEDVREEKNVSNLEDVISLLNNAKEEYLSSFKAYRIACEESEEVFYTFNDIVDVLDELERIDEAEDLAEALPDIEDKRRERPAPDELLELLEPIKSAGLLYFASKNKNSHSYDLNVSFAQEIAYTRRALLEDREYRGTKNAFTRLRQSFEELSTYMYQRFHQLGGTPNNYHGHDDRK